MRKHNEKRVKQQIQNEQKVTRELKHIETKKCEIKKTAQIRFLNKLPTFSSVTPQTNSVSDRISVPSSRLTPNSVSYLALANKLQTYQ